MKIFSRTLRERRHALFCPLARYESYSRSHGRYFVEKRNLRSAQSDLPAIDRLIAKYCTRDDIMPRAAEPYQRERLARLNCGN